MSTRYGFVPLLALISIVALAAGRQDLCAHTDAATKDSNWSDLMASMARMHSAMASVGPSGNSDANFVQMMLPHHQGAVDMAKAELVYGKDPQARRLAQEIITDQESEITLMQLWLSRRDASSKDLLHGPAATPGKEH